MKGMNFQYIYNAAAIIFVYSNREICENRRVYNYREMIDEKSISSQELVKETLKLAESLKELNCFVTMNKDEGIKKYSNI